MDYDIEKHVNKMLDLYTQGDFEHTLILAKNEYSDLTGPIHSEDDTFESRMNCFNDWYLFNFSYKDGTPLSHFYASTNELSSEIEKALREVQYTVFHYVKDSLRGKMVFKDLLHDKKINLEKDFSPGIVQGDVFVGRVLNYKDKNYLLSGILIIPSSVRGIIKKEAKKVRKLKDPEMEKTFVYKIENFAIRARRYSHLDPEKIFNF